MLKTILPDVYTQGAAILLPLRSGEKNGVRSIRQTCEDGHLLRLHAAL